MKSPRDNTDFAPGNICVTGILCLKGQGNWEGELPITLDCPGDEALGK